MRTVQEIFNVVIDNKYFRPFDEVVLNVKRASVLMCRSLLLALFDDLISFEEYKKAVDDIELYLGTILPKKHSILKHLLEDLNRPSSFKDRLHIYRNWADRPMTVLGK